MADKRRCDKCDDGRCANCNGMSAWTADFSQSIGNGYACKPCKDTGKCPYCHGYGYFFSS